MSSTFIPDAFRGIPHIDKSVQFRSPEMILKSLLEIQDDQYLIENLYNEIIRRVTKSARGTGLEIVVSLAYATARYGQINPVGFAQQEQEAKMDQFIDAITDDKDVASTAKACWLHVRRNTCGGLPTDLQQSLKAF